jgi:hypothetical protein
MAYRVPTFNLALNIWRFANFPGHPPDVVTVGNLSMGRRVVGTETSSFLPRIAPFVLLPKLTDVRCALKGGNSDFLEIPAGSGRYYSAEDVDDVAKGFPNEYRLCIMISSQVWPTPYP